MHRSNIPVAGGTVILNALTARRSVEESRPFSPTPDPEAVLEVAQRRAPLLSGRIDELVVRLSIRRRPLRDFCREGAFVIMTRRLAISTLLTFAVLILPPDVVMATSPASAGEQQAMTVGYTLATLAPKGSSLEKILQQMGQEWRRSGVDLTVRAGGAQGSEADTVRKLRQGHLDAALLTVVGLSEINDSVEALQNMPMMFNSLEEVDYVGEKLRPRIEKELRAKGYVVLFWADLGWVRFFSREPIVSPADLRKAKLFSWAGSIDEADILKAAGFTPVSLETADILPGLNSGVINAVALPPYYALATQVHLHAPNMLEINWAPLVGGLVVRERSWNRLTPDTQRELYRAAVKAGRVMKARNRADSEEAVRVMAERGLKVHRLPPEVETEWRRAAREAYPKIRGRIVPGELFDEVENHLSDFRKRR
jgi:TRAP-type transport system periplasmic protein